MCILVVAVGCHPALPFVCAHNREELRLRASGEDAWELDTGIVCSRDLQAGGTVLGVNAETGSFAALTNCRTPDFSPAAEEKLSRGRLVERMVAQGPEGVEDFISQNQDRLSGFHAVFGHVFGPNAGADSGSPSAPHLVYAWRTPEEDSLENERWQRWRRDSHALRPGEVFVISNENPTADAPWPKCTWLREKVAAFLEALPPRPRTDEVHSGLAEIMGRFDVPEIQAPARLPPWKPEEEERLLQSGPFTPWRPGRANEFGTVSQRVLISDAHTLELHYFHRSTNLGWQPNMQKPPECGPWACIRVPWRRARSPEPASAIAESPTPKRAKL